MTAVITQPTYLPWLGYFEQLARADVFVFLDNVQFESRGWDNRNRLATVAGQTFWLTVPVAAHPRNTLLKDVSIAAGHPGWRAEHLRSICTHLGKAPYFAPIYEPVREWLSRDYGSLTDLTVDGILLLARLLDLHPRFFRASQMPVDGRRSCLLAGLCETLGATHYYSAAGARAYMADEERLFADRGITVEYQSWTHPEYAQRTPRFISHLSTIDALMNIGPGCVRTLLVGS